MFSSEFWSTINTIHEIFFKFWFLHRYFVVIGWPVTPLKYVRLYWNVHTSLKHKIATPKYSSRRYPRIDQMNVFAVVNFISCTISERISKKLFRLQKTWLCGEILRKKVFTYSNFLSLFKLNPRLKRLTLFMHVRLLNICYLPVFNKT